MDKMIGNMIPVGVGGKRCACCYDSRKFKKMKRRQMKRRLRGSRSSFLSEV